MSSVEDHSPSAYLNRFGLAEFRPGQEDVIQAIVDGHDCLCIMPTGGGKSLCYQLPSIMRDGLTLVVSPLIALMKDQVDSLHQLGIQASFINSTLASNELNQRLDQMAVGKFDLMYIAPERFRSQRFLEALRRTKVQLLAVDEAHCISEWGHDFRHDYTRLGLFRKKLGNPQTIALTATATQDVRVDVAQQLELRSPKTFVAGFARPNLHYSVKSISGKKDKIDALIRFLRQNKDGCGIIYASTRKGCGEIAEEIASCTRRRIVVYHGGMAMDDRRHVQEAFMSGKAGIVVATNAFGMGIDKPDVRFVVHFNMPGSLEAYYQEAGRAGRDGLPSSCFMLYVASDRYIQEFFIDSAHPPPETIQAIYEFLRNHESDPIELTQDELKEELGLNIGAEGVGTCERLLEKAGVLERLEPNRNMAAVRIDSDAANLVDLLPKHAATQRKLARALGQRVGSRRFEFVYFRPNELADSIGIDIVAVNRALRELNKTQTFAYVPPFRGRAVRMVRRDVEFRQLDINFVELEARRKASLAKLDQVVQFALTAQCRQQVILRYFGDSSTETCENCDNCSQGRGHVVSVPWIDKTILIVLSGVARMRGRFGKNVVSQMLCGSNSAKIRKWKLDQLSTFGLLKYLAQSEVNQMLDVLASVGLVEQTEVNRFRPILNITAQGNLVMRGKTPVPSVSVPKSIERKLRFQYLEDAESNAESQFETTGNSVRIDSNEQKSPHSDSLSASGDTDTREINNRAMVSAELKPDFYWTWRLLNDGYGLQDCMAIRRLDYQTALDHGLRAVENQMRVSVEWLLSTDQIATIQAAISDSDSDSNVRQLVERLPKTFSYQMVLFYLKCRESSQTKVTK